MQAVNPDGTVGDKMYVTINSVRLFFDVVSEKFVTDKTMMRKRPTVVLLHGGSGLDHTMLKPSFTPLADVAQLVYLDHRSNGCSDSGNPEMWTLDQ